MPHHGDIMKFDLAKASHRLSALDIKFQSDNMLINVAWFRVMTASANWSIERHTHSSYEFHFIARGSCRVTLDSGEFEVNAGEFYITAPSVYHAQRNGHTDEVVEYCLNCDLDLINDIPSEAKHILITLSHSPCRVLKDSTGITEMFYKALSEAYYGCIGFYSNIKSLIIMILTAAARIAGEDFLPVFNIPLKKGKDDYRFDQIKKFIEDNISDSLSVKKIANYMYLSEKQILRIIHEKEGISTKEFVMRIKLKKAKELLKDPRLSIKHIANLLGFSSEYYFSQFFKRMEGYPPGIYRNNTIMS